MFHLPTYPRCSENECSLRDPSRSIEVDTERGDGVAFFNAIQSVEVGSSFLGSLDFGEGGDWVALTLNHRETVLIELDGVGPNGLDDPYLYISQQPGMILDSNDDVDPFGGDYSSALNFTASESGTYHIVAEAFSAVDIGDYVITVCPAEGQPVSAPSSSPLIDDITWGEGLESSQVNVFFAPSDYYYSDEYGSVTSESWNSYERGQFQKAFDLIEKSININFSIVNSEANADFVLLLDLDEIDVLGFFNPPGTQDEGIGVFNGDFWDRTKGGDLEVGGYGFVTIVHELLHGLGLAHPHDDAGESTIMDGVTAEFDDLGDFNLNQGVFTTMSYNSGLLDTFISDSSGFDGPYGFEAGPMAIDIAALQKLYGANTTHNSGNNVYSLPQANRTGTYWEAIWDTGGIDQIRYKGGQDTIIDLRAATLQSEEGGGGFLSGVANVAGGFTIANGVVIENAKSGKGNDVINGNNVDNDIRTGAGYDVVYGEAGNDIIYGQGWGDDLYGGRGEDTIFGGGGRDIIEGGDDADLIRGGGKSDTIYGENGADTLFGNGGRDYIRGEAGADKIDGGRHGDRIWGGSADDEIYGGRGNDRIWGDADDDMLFGRGGSDRLYGGSGNDILSGGRGSDVFVFNRDMDSDRITDLTGADTLKIASSLAGGRSAQQLAELAEINGGVTVMDFGLGDELTIEGTFGANQLTALIDIV